MLLLNSHKPLKGKVSENELFNEKKKKEKKVFYLTVTNAREEVVDGIWWCWNTDGASRLKNPRNLSNNNREAPKYHIFGCYVRN